MARVLALLMLAGCTAEVAELPEGFTPADTPVPPSEWLAASAGASLVMQPFFLDDVLLMSIAPGGGAMTARLPDGSCDGGPTRIVGTACTAWRINGTFCDAVHVVDAAGVPRAFDSLSPAGELLSRWRVVEVRPGTQVCEDARP